jgi:serine/threonine protein phosphatase 1
MSRTLCLGDIHARIEALKEVLTKSKFDYDKDKLILLGDVIDGGSNTYDVIEELLKIKNIIFVKGNHEIFFMDSIFKGTLPSEWINQGGANTLNSYGGKVIPGTYPEDEPVLVDVMGVRIPRTHIEFLNKTKLYHIENNMLFVHGGLDPNKPIQEQKEDVLLWDRSIIKYAETNNIQSYKKVFCGHTSTQLIEREFINYKCRNCKHEWEKKYEKKEDLTGNPICEECKSTNIFQSLGCTKPLKIGNLYCLDTGAGWDGKLTIMNIDNEEYWQSQLQTPSIL